MSLFWPGTPTHDGAAILQNDRIAAAGCLLPLTDSPIDDRRLGTRHRAALGLSELSDALVIVVSEETGTLSLANQGKLERPITSSRLQELLVSLIGNQNSMGTSKPSLSSTALSQKQNPSDNITNDVKEKEFNKSENLTNIKD